MPYLVKATFCCFYFENQRTCSNNIDCRNLLNSDLSTHTLTNISMLTGCLIHVLCKFDGLEEIAKKKTFSRTIKLL